MPVLNRIFEKVMYWKIYPQVRNTIITQQHGFTKGRTVESNLLEFTYYISKTMDNTPPTQIDVVYTDLQKAFDKVNHQILLQKLRNIGFSTSAVALFASYLNQSRQYVKYNGVRSYTYRCTTGVPQGRNLAPLFFLIYINNIPEHLKHSRFLLFADDLKIFKEIVTQQDADDLRADLRGLEQWSKENHLPLNVKKCKTLTFTRKRCQINSEYYIQGEKLEQVDIMRDLGVLMEGKLSYKKHIQKIQNNKKKPQV